MSNDAHHHDEVGHIVPVKILAATGGALIFLTFITVWVAGIDFGAANIYVALAIACVKASLVLLFFMHLRWDRPFNAITFIGSVCFMMLFIAFALADTAAYRPDLDGGDGVAVQQHLTALAGEADKAAATPAEH